MSEEVQLEEKCIENETGEKLPAACKTGKTREASRLLSDGANIEYEDFLSRATRVESDPL